MKRIVAMSTAACLVVAGCAQFYKPAVDLKGADQAKYETDLVQLSEVRLSAHYLAPCLGFP